MSCTALVLLSMCRSPAFLLLLSLSFPRPRRGGQPTLSMSRVSLGRLRFSSRSAAAVCPAGACPAPSASKLRDGRAGRQARARLCSAFTAGTSCSAFLGAKALPKQHEHQLKHSVGSPSFQPAHLSSPKPPGTGEGAAGAAPAPGWALPPGPPCCHGWRGSHWLCGTVQSRDQ